MYMVLLFIYFIYNIHKYTSPVKVYIILQYLRMSVYISLHDSPCIPLINLHCAVKNSLCILAHEK